MVSAYPVLTIILLRVTPSAKRNSYRVAAAYVCFVMEGIMFVSMDVGVAAGGIPVFPRGEGVLSKRLKHTKYELPPLGEG